MDKKDLLNIGDKQIELRRKQWEALYKKYKRRGKINTDACYFSEINYKMFIKPASKVKTKKKAKKKNSSRIDKPSTETIDFDPEANEADRTTNIVSYTDAFINLDASHFIDEDSNNDVFTPRNSSNKSNWKGNQTCYQSDSPDSGLEMGEEEIPETYTSPSNKFINIDVSEIIDESSDTTLTEICIEPNDNIEVYSTVNDGMDSLIHFIENGIKSNLKEILKNRSVSKLLESDDYSYWHKCSKQEMTKLEKCVSRKDLKAYMRHCCNADIPEYITVHLIKDLIDHKMKSNLQTLFLKREFSKNDEKRYFKYRKRISVEWQRLCETVPVDYLLLYGKNILFSIEKLKERALPSNKNT